MAGWGLADLSRARRGWRQEWRGWAHGRALGELEVWLQPGTARQTAGVAVTARRILPLPPPGERTGRRAPKASSYLSGMQVLPNEGGKPGMGWGWRWEWGDIVLNKHRKYIFISKTPTFRSQI